MKRFTLTIWLFSSLPLLLLPIGCASDTQVYRLEQKVDRIVEKLNIKEEQPSSHPDIKFTYASDHKMLVDSSRVKQIVAWKLTLFLPNNTKEEYTIDDIDRSPDLHYNKFREITTKKWIRTNLPFTVSELDVGESRSGEIQVTQTP